MFHERPALFLWAVFLPCPLYNSWMKGIFVPTGVGTLGVLFLSLSRVLDIVGLGGVGDDLASWEQFLEQHAFQVVGLILIGFAIGWLAQENKALIVRLWCRMTRRFFFIPLELATKKLYSDERETPTVQLYRRLSEGSIEATLNMLANFIADNPEVELYGAEREDLPVRRISFNEIDGAGSFYDGGKLFTPTGQGPKFFNLYVSRKDLSDAQRRIRATYLTERP